MFVLNACSQSFQGFVSVYHSNNSVALNNSMVYKISNTLTICLMWCQNFCKTWSCT